MSAGSRQESVSVGKVSVLEVDHEECLAVLFMALAQTSLHHRTLDVNVIFENEVAVVI